MKIKKESAMGGNDELNARIKSRMDALNKRIADRMAALDARLGGTVAVVKEFPDGSLESWLQPDFDDIKMLFDYIRGSNIVRDNPVYSAALDKVDLLFLTDPANPESNKVNAGAHRGGRKITLYAGFARQSRIAGSALAVPNGVAVFKRLLDVVHDNPEWAYCITMDEAKRLFSWLGLRHDAIIADEAMRHEAIDRSSAVILATLAHEAGHIALGHVNANVDYYKANLEVARNQERQADSFMSSVIATVPFGEHMFEAELFNDYLNAVAEMKLGMNSDKGHTHPLSIERYNNLLKDHPDLAEKYGFPQLESA